MDEAQPNGEPPTLRDLIAEAVGPHLSTFRTTDDLDDWVDGVGDSIVDSVLEALTLDALGLEQVGWRCTEHVSGAGTLIEMSKKNTFSDCVLVPVYTLTNASQTEPAGGPNG